jgi:hypothetical protein
MHTSVHTTLENLGILGYHKIYKCLETKDFRFSHHPHTVDGFRNFPMAVPRGQQALPWRLAVFQWSFNLKVVTAGFMRPLLIVAAGPDSVA